MFFFVSLEWFWFSFHQMMIFMLYKCEKNMLYKVSTLSFFREFVWKRKINKNENNWMNHPNFCFIMLAVSSKKFHSISFFCHLKACRDDLIQMSTSSKRFFDPILPNYYSHSVKTLKFFYSEPIIRLCLTDFSTIFETLVIDSKTYTLPSPPECLESQEDWQKRNVKTESTFMGMHDIQYEYAVILLNLSKILWP